MNCFHIVTAAGAGGESTNSLPAGAPPLPANLATNAGHLAAFPLGIHGKKAHRIKVHLHSVFNELVGSRRG